MKKKDLANLRLKEVDELKEKAEHVSLEHKKSKVNLKAGKEKNFKKAKNLAHELAQIRTLIHEKELISKEI